MNNLNKIILAVCAILFLAVAYPIGAGFSHANYDDTPPDPPYIEGPTDCKIWVEYDYNITITDPDQDRLTELYVRFGDGTNLTLKPPGSGCCKGWRSGITLAVSHKWKRFGNYSVEAKVRDIRWNWSDWGSLNVHVSKNVLEDKMVPKTANNEFLFFIKKFLYGAKYKTQISYMLLVITAHESKAAIRNRFS